METRLEPGAVGLIGLGLMGTALTERLLEHGYRVTVWNRTRAKTSPPHCCPLQRPLITLERQPSRP